MFLRPFFVNKRILFALRNNLTLGKVKASFASALAQSIIFITRLILRNFADMISCRIIYASGYIII